MNYEYKHKLINSLGGFNYNDKDLHNIYAKGFNAGQVSIIKKIHNSIKSYYGLSKQEWIDKVWYLITHAHFTNHTKSIINETY